MKHIYYPIFLLFFFAITAQSSIAQRIVNPEVKTFRSEKFADIKLFPNPAVEIFSLNITSQELNYITINNIIGKEVRRVKINPNNTYDVSDLRRGIYIVRVFNNTDELVKALRLSKVL